MYLYIYIYVLCKYVCLFEIVMYTHIYYNKDIYYIIMNNK